MRLKPVFRGGAIAMLALALAATMAAAQGSFGDDLFFLDEDALFGSGDGLLIEIEEPTGSALQDVFLVSDGVEFGGNYRLALEAARNWADGQAEQAVESVGVSLNGSLFADARPRRDFRLFAKSKWTAGIADGAAHGPTFQLHELFADYSAGDRAFLRAGKQTINWGVGYFFSPADIVNVGRIDPENPDAEREGPVALRLHVPSGRNNFYNYAVLSNTAGGQVALAPKAEFVMGRSEVGVGLYYRADRAPRAMATLSTSLGKASLFGEAVLSKGSDKRFVRSVPISPEHPFGLAVTEDKESLFAHVTAGVHYTYTDPDRRYSISGAGQYYYNGEGYDGAFVRENGPGIFALVQAGELSFTDIISTGRQYGALSVNVSGKAMGDFAPGLFWLGNLSDGSGLVSLSVGYTRWNHVSPTIGISRTYGAPGGQYAPKGPEYILTLGVSVGHNF